MIVELLNSEVVNIYSAEPKQRNSNYTYVVAPYEPIEILPTQKKIGLQFINGVVTDVIIDMTPEEIAEQELEKQKLLKQQQYEELLPTDWYVVRFMETGVAIPEEILKQRQEIRDKYK